ncbi:MAG TPA: hypothetical protein VMS22_08285 [Candidatus Eisenbacteria bacterium]|nr:hypothetical protein [Candidatus Eisenbacteria bacterium]
MVDAPTENALRRALVDANQTGHVTIRFAVSAPIAIVRPLPYLTAPFVTVEGNGGTLDGSNLAKDVALLDIRTHDVVVRDLRLRNGYDNLRIQGSEAANVLVSHVSSTGAADDGISIGYGAHDVTVAWSFLAGNTRSLFCKYGETTHVSVHHSWLQKGWIRSPLFFGPMVADLRNVIVEDWGEWGSRFSDGASGNVVDSLFVLSPYARKAGGKSDSGLRLVDSGPVYLSGNAFRGTTMPALTGTASAPVPTAPVHTQAVAVMEPAVRSRAGCLPRDRLDRAYIDLRDGWHVGRAAPLRPSATVTKPKRI